MAPAQIELSFDFQAFPPLTLSGKSPCRKQPRSGCSTAYGRSNRLLSTVDEDDFVIVKEDIRKKQKKSKWRDITVTDNVNFNRSLLPRSPVEDQACENENQFFEADDMDVFLEELSAQVDCMGKYLRMKKKWVRPRVKLAVKDKYVRHFHHKDGSRIFINHRVFKRLKVPPNPSVQSKTQPVAMCSRAIEVTVWKQARTTKTTDRSQQQRARAQRHELVKSKNQPSDMDDELAVLLQQLQHRDITPEDYEVLLRLDESVKVKTVDTSAVNTFLVRIFEASDEELLCNICMDDYRDEQTIMQLPECGHEFHECCIRLWLTTHSTVCPLDGLPIQMSLV